MRAILISIRPQWVELILNGIKKDEIRKGTGLYKAINKLIAEQGVAPMLIYCTKERLLVKLKSLFGSSVKFFTEPKTEINEHFYKGETFNGKVVARFNATADLLELKMIEGGLFFAKPDKEVIELDLNENAQIDNFKLLRYTGYKLGTQISDIHIANLEIFDKPKEIWEFMTPKNAKIYKSDLEQAYEDDYEIGTRIAEGVADDNECANCVELTEMSKGYYGLQCAPQSYCYIEILGEYNVSF